MKIHFPLQRLKHISQRAFNILNWLELPWTVFFFFWRAWSCVDMNLTHSRLESWPRNVDDTRVCRNYTNVNWNKKSIYSENWKWLPRTIACRRCRTQNCVIPVSNESQVYAFVLFCFLFNFNSCGFKQSFHFLCSLLPFVCGTFDFIFLLFNSVESKI